MSENDTCERGNDRFNDDLRRIEDEFIHSSMDILESITSSATCQVKLTTEFTAICPTDGHRDQYDLLIEYEPNGRLIELESLGEFIDQFSGEVVSQEGICTFIHKLLGTHFGFENLTVRVTGEHYGIEAVTEVQRVE